PTNISAMFLKANEVEIVTGVTLPMVIKLAWLNREVTLSELAKEVEDQGKEAICRAGILLEPQRMKKDAWAARSDPESARAPCASCGAVGKAGKQVS